NEGMDLIGLVRLVNKHIRKVRKYGISAERVIDTLRPHTQRIWRSLSDRDKRIFMSRFRHLWSVARHRIPLHTHDLIQQLRIEGRLQVRAGRILDMQETDGSMSVEYHDKRAGELRTLLVQRVINC